MVKSSEGLLGSRGFSRTYFRSSLSPEEGPSCLIFDSFNFHQTNNLRYSIRPKINIRFNTDLNFISKYIYDDGCLLVVGSSLSLYDNSITTIQGTLPLMRATVQCECVVECSKLQFFSRIILNFFSRMCFGKTRLHAKFEVSSLKILARPPVFVIEIQ